MEEELIQEEDITKTGPVGLKGLKGINQQDNQVENLPFYQQLERLYSTQGTRATLQQLQGSAMEDLTKPLIQQGYGESRLDKRLENELQLTEGLANFRGEEQSALGQIANGLAKGAVLAGTTFLDGTLGLLYGSAVRLGGGEKGSMWNNEISQALKATNEWAEKVLPNYYTKQEQEQPWYQNIFSANFLGDKFIKNLGFTIGAFYSGGVATSGLKAAKIPQLIGAIAKSSKAAAMVNASVGAAVSAVNEGRIEALNNSTDWFNLHKQQLDDSYMAKLQQLRAIYGVSPEYMVAANIAQKDYDEALAKLSEDQAKMGNADLLMNLPILMASNLFEFGKLYANGFKTARRTTNIAKSAEGTYEMVGRNKVIGALKGVGNALSEGTEEIAQKAASLAAGNYYNVDVNNFYKSKIDPQASQETLDWVKAMGQAINETVNDGSSWEEFTIGALTGLLGMPVFGKQATKTQNAYLGKGKSIGLAGGLWGDVRDYNEETKRQQEIVDYLNGRINTPEFKNYYQGLIRHNKYQTLMDEAALNDDAFNFKNAEQAQLVSDIMMFANAGKTQDLVDLVNAAFDTSDENLESIVKNTSTTDDAGKTVSPFADSKGNPIYATAEGKQKMIDQLTKSKDEILKTIDDYNKVINSIDSKTGEALTDEQLEELAWIKLQTKNWQDRASEMTGETKESIGRVIGLLEQASREYQRIINEEGVAHADITEKSKKAEESLKKVSEWISVLDFTRGIPNEGMLNFLKMRPSFTKEVTDLIDALGNLVDTESANTIKGLFSDLDKIRKGTEIFNKKYDEYTSNPSKITEEHTATEEKIAQEEINKKKDTIKAEIKNATNLSQLREIVRNANEPALMAESLDELENDGNQLVKDYRETGRYFEEVKEKINQQQDVSDDAKEDAIRLVTNQYENSNNLMEMANPLGSDVMNEEAFLEDTGGDIEAADNRFQQARYVALKAMLVVNRNEKFKQTFSEAYTNPPMKADSPAGVAVDTTGSDDTATIPSVNSTSSPTFTMDKPVGDVTFDKIKSENGTIESSKTSQQLPKSEGKKKYYMPAIPQLGIDQAKQGQMVPFNEAMRAKSLDFDKIYNYLKDSGAFEYINSGQLKVGDTIEFMIDPSFNTNTIFMVTKKTDGTYQVVGSLQETIEKVTEFEGLQTLQDEIKDADNKSGGASAKFYYNGKSTKVSQVLIGKIEYTNNEIELQNIPGVINNIGEAPKFAVMKNGRLIAPGIDNSNIIQPINIKPEMEGRLYLLVKNAAGKYSPVTVRVKHFNEKEFNPIDNNGAAASTPIGNGITEAIGKIARALLANDEGLLRQGVGEFTQFVYSQDLRFNFENGNQGTYLSIKKIRRNPDGSVVMTTNDSGKQVAVEDKVENFYTTTFNGESNSLETIFNQIYNVLQSLNLPIQVSTNSINKVKNYNERLINSGVLTSNIAQASTLNSFFITDYFADGKLTPANKIPSVSVKPAEKTPVGGSKSAIPGTRVRSIFSDKTYYINTTNHTIKDENGNDIKITTDNEILFDLAWADENYGNATDIPNVMKDNKIITPSGKVLDRTNQKYLADATAMIIKQQLKQVTQKNTETAQASVEIPAIFKPNTELQANAITDPSVNDNTSDKVGMYELDGKVHRGKLKPLANVNGVDIYYTKLPQGTREESASFNFNKTGESKVEIPVYQYVIIFPNGKSFFGLQKATSDNDDSVTPKLVELLNSKPDLVKTRAIEETALTKVKPTWEQKTTQAKNNTTVQAAKRANNILEGLKGKNDKVPTQKKNDRIPDDSYTERNVQARFRETTEQPFKVWNKEKELAWLNKVLPQLTQQDRVRIAKGLIQVGEMGTTAWGMLDKGIVTLSDIAAEGTTYHEAFHVVFNMLLSQKERQALYEEARKKFGDKSLIDLEEDMAEGFREYVMSRDSRSWGQKIIDFFKNLYAKVTNWKTLQPNLTAYYRAINGGKYVKDILADNDITVLRSEEYTSEMQSIKDKAIADGTFMKAPNGNSTNLTEKQWLQVRTKNFKDWFGDWENNPANASKVVDENGEPLVVYHHTNNSNLVEFSSDFENYFTKDGGTKEAIFFDENKTGVLGRKYDIPVFLNIKDLNEYNETKEQLHQRGTSYRAVVNESANKNNIDGGVHMKNFDDNKMEHQSIWIVHNPNQIKSATDNVGTFSKTNNDIRYRVTTTSTLFNNVDPEIKDVLVSRGWTEDKWNSISEDERQHAIKCYGV